LSSATTTGPRPQETDEHAPAAPAVEPSWFAAAREIAEELGPGRYLAYEGDDGIEVKGIHHGWTRIGRSVIAGLRLNDPTVSRRHAIVVCEESGVRVLDDRSLNGLRVNGEAADWATLRDGDELIVGRYSLYLLSV